MFVRRWLKRVPDPWMPVVFRGGRVARAGFWRKVRAWRELLGRSQCWSREQLEEYQWQRMQALLLHAGSTVPYYRFLFRKLGANPEDFRSLEDVRRLPTLDRATVQARLEDFLATDCPATSRVYATTGGSTGIPVGVYFDKSESDATEWAFITALWARVGYRDGARCAVVRGAVVSNGRLWEADPLRNCLVLSSYHLTQDRVSLYLERLRRFQPEFIQAYPSAVSMLARLMLERGERPVEGVRAILCGSENLYEWQRAEIERAFRSRVYSWYGQTERVCLAGECEYDSALHIFPEYGFTELLDAEGRMVEEPGRVGEIVATGFLSRCMPLIRYRTTDAAAYARGYCEHCGRRYRRFERIEGRLQEFLVTATDRYISMTAINMHSPVFDRVRQFQFYQDTLGKTTLRVVPRDGYGPSDEREIRNELGQKLGSDMELSIQVVEAIPRTQRGKLRFLDQRLPLRFGDR